MTKTQYAQVIVQALLYSKLHGKQPDKDHPEVVRLAKRSKLQLEPLHKQAVNIILSNDWLRENAS